MPDIAPSGLLLPESPVILSGGLYGPEGGQHHTGAVSAAWPEANLAIFVPLRLPRRRALAALGFLNGATVSGNFDVGLYTLGGKRLLSLGSTAQAGTNAIQKVAKSATIAADAYLLGLAMDNTTGTNIRSAAAAGLEFLKLCGLCQMAAAFPLPATATFASLAYNYEPNAALFFRSTP